MIIRRFLVLFVILTTSVSSAFAGIADSLEPENTYAVIVGVLEWQDRSLQTYSKADRKDAELHRVLLKRGVPKDQMRLLLDEEATRERILEATAETLKQAGPDSTFLFYFAGHGMRSGQSYCFANYDIDLGRQSATGFDVKSLAKLIEERFRGERVLLMADCCHSGSLALVVEDLADTEISAACLTSVSKNRLSTNNWTFTQTIIDGFRGRPIVDRNADGFVSFGELSLEVKTAMHHWESQPYGFGVHRVSPDWNLAPTLKSPRNEAADPKTPRYGEFVLARDSSGWQPGRIIGASDDGLHVQLRGYAHRPVLRVSERDVRVLRPKEIAAEPAPSIVFEVGSEVLVERDERMWPAKVMRCQNGRCEVRLVEGKAESIAVEYAQIATLERELEPYSVLVEWGGKWWPAAILSEEGERYHIRYIGWSDQWNETISAQRLRRLESKEKPSEKEVPEESSETIDESQSPRRR